MKEEGEGSLSFFPLLAPTSPTRSINEPAQACARTRSLCRLPLEKATMSTAPAASGGGGADTTANNPAPAPPPPLPEIDDRVYKAVVYGHSPKRLKRLIEELAQGDDERRKAAVNKAGKNESGDDESPLQAARRLDHADLIGVLVEAGADVMTLHERARDACCHLLHVRTAGRLERFVAQRQTRPQRKGAGVLE